MSIGDRIKYLRKKNNLTMQQLGNEIGASSGNIGDWEHSRAKPGADALIALSQVFNVSTDWLLTGEGRGPEEQIITPVPGQISFDDLFSNKDSVPASIPPGMSLFDYFNSITESLFADPEQTMTPEQQSKIIYLADKLKNIVENERQDQLDDSKPTEQLESNGSITENQIPLFQRIGKAIMKIAAKKPNKDIEEMIEEMIARDGYAIIDIEKEMPEYFREVQALEASVKSLELKDTIKLLKKLPYSEIKEVRSFIDYRLSRIEQSGPQDGRSSNYQSGEEAAGLDKAIG